MTAFKKECEEYSIDDLELIIETQKDLYNNEEMKCLIEMLDIKRQAAEIERIKNLPKEIICPKCDIIISAESEKCPYCEFEFGKDIYQYAVNDDIEYEDDSESSNMTAYVFSFIIPLVGFILGSNLMSKDDEDEKSQGVICIILGIVSMIISAVVWFITLN